MLKLVARVTGLNEGHSWAIKLNGSTFTEQSKSRCSEVIRVETATLKWSNWKYLLLNNLCKKQPLLDNQTKRSTLRLSNKKAKEDWDQAGTYCSEFSISAWCEVWEIHAVKWVELVHRRRVELPERSENWTHYSKDQSKLICSVTFHDLLINL